jgi:hypothetical protein
MPHAFQVSSFDRPQSIILQQSASMTQLPSLRDPLSESPSRTPTPLLLRSSVHESVRTLVYSSSVQAGTKASARRTNGRQTKIKADIRLLGGRWTEAFELYNEALSLTKASNDSVWQAATLEGLVTVQILQAWASSTKVCINCINSSFFASIAVTYPYRITLPTRVLRFSLCITFPPITPKQLASTALPPTPPSLLNHLLLSFTSPPVSALRSSSLPSGRTTDGTYNPCLFSSNQPSPTRRPTSDSGTSNLKWCITSDLPSPQPF